MFQQSKCIFRCDSFCSQLPFNAWYKIINTPIRFTLQTEPTATCRCCLWSLIVLRTVGVFSGSYILHLIWKPHTLSHRTTIKHNCTRSAVDSYSLWFCFKVRQIFIVNNGEPTAKKKKKRSKALIKITKWNNYFSQIKGATNWGLLGSFKLPDITLAKSHHTLISSSVEVTWPTALAWTSSHPDIQRSVFMFFSEGLCCFFLELLS